ncbi:hypothetical protein scyTo_0008689 [Scyliorhinus torazame]|uniref:Uncharacterized protein n=1 Tax=Scyliorhinus torazame TaxID=75743 RepID=A0A401PCJ8_SCYTO|nr:hypothetical protein [Scyliorhinus torazame]
MNIFSPALYFSWERHLQIRLQLRLCVPARVGGATCCFDSKRQSLKQAVKFNMGLQTDLITSQPRNCCILPQARQLS